MVNNIYIPNYKLSICDSIELINAPHWKSVTNNGNVYLTIDYLRSIEHSNPDNLIFKYVIFYNELLKPVAAAYFQIIHFVDKGFKFIEMVCPVKNIFKKKLLESIDITVLLCGNIFACGENGFAYTSEVNSKDAFLLLSDGMKGLTRDTERNGQISLSLFKEFWPETVPEADSLTESRYKGFNIDVNMVMTIHPDWKKMDDYLSVMSTKFRTKVKGVYKKSEKVRVENFSADDIKNHAIEISDLYGAVTSKATYNFANLKNQAFVNFKQSLKEKFIFKAYFIDKKMVGFSSLFYFDNILDANYVGLDYDYIKEYAIYQRMLYDFVDLSIKLGVKKLRLGRTAELIKSSIGAEPVNMKLYVKHRNSISNKLLGPFIQSIKPSSFELRLPFKKEFA